MAAPPPPATPAPQVQQIHKCRVARVATFQRHACADGQTEQAWEVDVVPAQRQRKPSSPRPDGSAAKPAGEAPRLNLAVVYPGEPGVTLEALPILPLMPEVGHGRLLLEQAACELLAGDGWDAYVKPFRSLEDLYVLAALTAWLYGVGQECAWPQALRLRLLSVLAGCAEGSRQCADSVGCHLLLAGLFGQFQALRADIDEALLAGPAQWAQLWQRDQGVLALAAAARDKRLAKAWAAAGLS